MFNMLVGLVKKVAIGMKGINRIRNCNRAKRLETVYGTSLNPLISQGGNGCSSLLFYRALHPPALIHVTTFHHYYKVNCNLEIEYSQWYMGLRNCPLHLLLIFTKEIAIPMHSHSPFFPTWVTYFYLFTWTAIQNENLITRLTIKTSQPKLPKLFESSAEWSLYWSVPKQ
jgi:hypothetical protein